MLTLNPISEFHQDRIDTVVDIEMSKLSEPKPRV